MTLSRALPITKINGTGRWLLISVFLPFLCSGFHVSGYFLSLKHWLKMLVRGYSLFSHICGASEDLASFDQLLWTHLLFKVPNASEWEVDKVGSFSDVKAGSEGGVNSGSEMVILLEKERRNLNFSWVSRAFSLPGPLRGGIVHLLILFVFSWTIFHHWLFPVWLFLSLSFRRRSHCWRAQRCVASMCSVACLCSVLFLRNGLRLYWSQAWHLASDAARYGGPNHD